VFAASTELLLAQYNQLEAEFEASRMGISVEDARIAFQ
jgi:hypothetical protein